MADHQASGTRVMSGRWVAPTAWKAKRTVRGNEEPHSDEGRFAATATVQGVRMVLSRCADMRDKAYEAFVGDYTQACLNAEVRDGEQRCAQPPGGWKTKTSSGRETGLCGRFGKHCQACARRRDAGRSTSRKSCKTKVLCRVSETPMCCSWMWSAISGTRCWQWVQKMRRDNCCKS